MTLTYFCYASNHSNSANFSSDNCLSFGEKSFKKKFGHSQGHLFLVLKKCMFFCGVYCIRLPNTGLILKLGSLILESGWLIPASDGPLTVSGSLISVPAAPGVYILQVRGILIPKIILQGVLFTPTKRCF